MINSKVFKTALLASAFLLGSASAVFAVDAVPTLYTTTKPTSTQNENTDYMRKYELEKLKRVQAEIKQKKALIIAQRALCNKNVANLLKERAKGMVTLYNQLKEQGMAKSDIYEKAKAYRSETESQVKALKLSCQNTEKKVLGISTDGTVQ